MIKISIPNNNLQERKYIIDIIFNEFLGLDYKVIVGSDSNSWEIILENGKKLTIEDTFFNKYPNDLEYLHVDNIPSKIEELDIFAASFFMLSRWEEYVNKTRDKHNRFPVHESLAYKQGFLDRPIVNEYVESLKKILLASDENLNFKKRDFEVILTHDVDHIRKWDTPLKFARHLLGDIILRRSWKAFQESMLDYIAMHFGSGKDPFDTFEQLIKGSEAIGVKSRFYFMSGGVTSYDNNYKIDEPNSLELIEKIKKREHTIGIHPSYNAYNCGEQFKKEKGLLEKVVGENIIEGRDHYLRFEVPTTWQIWEDNGMEIDSTCGYADQEGFRCGVCYEYSVFNILMRKKLRLKERPMIVMDESLTRNNLGVSDIFANVKKLIMETKKYNGQFVLLWHNSSFNTQFWNRYQGLYENILSELSNETN